MTVHTYLPEETVIRRAIEALMVALGPVETARFLTLDRDRYLDSVEFHRQWQDGLNMEQFLDQVFGPESRFESQD